MRRLVHCASTQFLVLQPIPFLTGLSRCATTGLLQMSLGFGSRLGFLCVIPIACVCGWLHSSQQELGEGKASWAREKSRVGKMRRHVRREGQKVDTNARTVSVLHTLFTQRG